MKKQTIKDKIEEVKRILSEKDLSEEEYCQMVFLKWELFLKQTRINKKEIIEFCRSVEFSFRLSCYDKERRSYIENIINKKFSLVYLRKNLISKEKAFNLLSHEYLWADESTFLYQIKKIMVQTTLLNAYKKKINISNESIFMYSLTISEINLNL